jgi:hypothetical protein
VLEPDADDRRFKAGFWKQDGAFLAGVRAGRQPPFPSPSLADAHATMVLLDRLCGLPAVADAVAEGAGGSVRTAAVSES